jgi:hypothetical protein
MSLLGFDAVGRLALGQIRQDGPTTTVLSAQGGAFAISSPAIAFRLFTVDAAGAFTRTGNAAVFKVIEPAVSGAFALSGVSATFPLTWPIAGASFTLTGYAAADTTTEPAAGTSYTITGKPAAFPITFSAARGAFTLTGKAAVFPITWPVVGTSYAAGFNPAGLSITLEASPGSFALTGYRANEPLYEDADGATFVFTGSDATLLRYGADFPLVYGGVGHYLEEIERQRQLSRITRTIPPPIDRRTVPQFAPLQASPIAPPARRQSAIALPRMPPRKDEAGRSPKGQGRAGQKEKSRHNATAPEDRERGLPKTRAPAARLGRDQQVERLLTPPYCDDCARNGVRPATGPQCFAVCSICKIRRACFGDNPEPQAPRLRRIPECLFSDPLR